MRNPTSEHVYPTVEDRRGQVVDQGLSLRDHFAGLVLSAMVQNGDQGGPLMLAEYAYNYADQMLKVRGK